VFDVPSFSPEPCEITCKSFIVKKIIEYESIKFDLCPEISKKLDGNPNIFNYLKLIKTKVVVSESLFLISIL